MRLHAFPLEQVCKNVQASFMSPLTFSYVQTLHSSLDGLQFTHLSKCCFSYQGYIPEAL